MCEAKKTVRRKIRFRIGEVFPANSAVAQFLVRLCIVTNDVVLTQENTGQEYARGDGHRAGVPLHYAWSAAAYLREAAKMLDKDLDSAEVQAFVASLRPETQARLQRLRASFTPWDGSFIAETLKPLRDRTFHYPTGDEIRDALDAVQDIESGLDLQRGSMGESRFDFADEVVTSRVASVLGGSHEAAEAALRRVAELIVDLMHFAHEAVTAWLKTVDRSQLTFEEIAEPETD